MANLRGIKKDVDYLVEEILSDCFLAIHFRPEKKEQVSVIMQKAVDLHNNLFDAINNPPEKNNRSLLKKHYAHIRREMIAQVDNLFEELSALSN